jgi:cell division transport system permease protein
VGEGARSKGSFKVLLSFVVAEALRDVRRAGRVGVSAVLLIALSLAALGGFWLFSLNLGRAIDQWRDRVRVVVYLKDEPSGAAALDALQRKVESVGGVQRVRYVSKSDALGALKRSLGPQADVAEQLPRNPLPASIEVTPDAATATPDGTRALVGRLATLPEVDEVQGGAQWVEGLAQFQHLFQLVGLLVGAVLALEAILTVTTATTLVLHLRRDEMEIMRLVGATETVIRLPRVLQGMAQGLVAATISLAVLEAAYAVAAPRLEPLLPLTLGLQRAVFLSIPQMLVLMVGGAALGAMGGLLARGRVKV